MALIIVTTGSDTVADDGQTSLREALQIARSTGGADTIVFAAGVAEIELGAGGPLTIASGEVVRIIGDRNGDGVADVTIDGNGATHHVTVEAGANATFTSLNFVRGVGTGAVGVNGNEGSPGYYGFSGEPGGVGGMGENGAAGGGSAGAIVNYGTTTVVRSQFAENNATGGAGGTGGVGGQGGDGAAGIYGGTGVDGQHGGAGGMGGTGGTGGTGGHAGGAIFNGAGATLNLIDAGFGNVINGATGTETLIGNSATGGMAGSGGSGGTGGHGGLGGDGGDPEFYPGFYDDYGNYHYGVYGPSGAGGNGGDGGNGGNGGNGGSGGTAAGAIVNLGIINSTGTQSIRGNMAGGGQPGIAGTAGNGSNGGTGGTGGNPFGVSGSNGGAGGPGESGLDGSPGNGSNGVGNVDGGTSNVAAADVIYYIYAPTTQVIEGDAGVTTIAFYVNRQGSTAENQTVSWQVNGGPGIDGADFASGLLPSGSFSFTAGQNAMIGYITIASDLYAELSETFTIQLTGVTDGVGGLSHALGTSAATVTILNDDPLVTLYSSATLATPVQGFTTASAFSAALAAAASGQAIDVDADAMLGNVGAQTVTADNLTIFADAPFNASLVMTGAARTLTLGGTANVTVVGNDAGPNTIIGNSGANTIVGGALGNVIAGGAGGDTLSGGAGADRFDFNAIGDSTITNAGRDVITNFEQGVDLIDLADIDALVTAADHQNFNFIGTRAHTGAGATLRYTHSSGNTIIYGDVNADGVGDFSILLHGIHNLTADDFTDASITAVSGGSGNDLVLGSAGVENLYGLQGNDTLRGGLGADFHFGGTGADVYDFNAVAEIGLGSGSRDVIIDFEYGDLIDLDDIDANVNVAGQQHFTFINTLAHTGGGATLRYEHNLGMTIVSGDVNGDGVADFELQLLGTHYLQSYDFTDASIAVIQGGAGDESLFAGPGGKLMLGLGGHDFIVGGAGADTIRGGTGFDTMTGSSGADRFDFNAATEFGNAVSQRDVITDFEQGVDLIDFNDIDANTVLAGKQVFTWLGQGGHTGAGATLRYVHSGGNTLIYGDVNADGAGDFTLQLNGIRFLTAADFTAGSIGTIQGTNGNDILTGAPGGKAMLGRDGDDTMTGGAGADTIVGGAGADSMTGGLGADVFKWSSHTETGNAIGTRDIITDFQKGVDRIDLSGIDANVNVAGDQAFTFLGTAVHTGAGATLRYLQAGGNTLVYGDINGDKAADFTIQLAGLHTLVVSDFVL